MVRKATGKIRNVQPEKVPVKAKKSRLQRQLPGHIAGNIEMLVEGCNLFPKTVILFGGRIFHIAIDLFAIPEDNSIGPVMEKLPGITQPVDTLIKILGDLDVGFSNSGTGGFQKAIANDYDLLSGHIHENTDEDCSSQPYH